MKKEHLGTNFDSFLEEEGILAEVAAVASKRLIAYQISQLMAEKKLTKTEMAAKMKTSRAALNRLLDPNNNSVTLVTLESAAKVLDKRLKLELV